MLLLLCLAGWSTGQRRVIEQGFKCFVGSIEIFRDPDLALIHAHRARLALRACRYQLGYWYACPRDGDFFSRRYSLQEPGQVGFRLVNIHFHGILKID